MTPDSLGALLVRVDRLDRDVEKLDTTKAEKSDYESLTEEMRTIRRGLYAFALGLPIGGVTFLLGILALVQPG